ncbi:MAG: mechanosensitive ion channel family protein [Desulfovibrio sp.]
MTKAQQIWMQANELTVQYLAQAEEKLLTLDNLIEICILFTVLLLTVPLAKKATKILKANPPAENAEPFFIRVYDAAVSVMTPLILFFSVGLTTLVTKGANLDPNILLLGTHLSAVWIILRFASRIALTPFWARLVSSGAWCIAALMYLDVMNPVLDFLEKNGITYQNKLISLSEIISSLLTAALLLYLGNVLLNIIDARMSTKKEIPPSSRMLISKSGKVFLWAAVIMITPSLMGLELDIVTMFSGAFGLGIGIGFKNVFSNLISGFILLLDRSIKPGDIISLDGNQLGEVTALHARYTILKNRSGDELLVPNEDLITSRVQNSTFSNTDFRVRIPVGIAYGSDMDVAFKAIFDAADKFQREFTKKPGIRVMSLDDSQITLELRVWVKASSGYGKIRSDILQQIIRRLDEANIEIPFPQQEINLRVQQQIEAQAGQQKKRRTIRRPVSRGTSLSRSLKRAKRKTTAS